MVAHHLGLPFRVIDAAREANLEIMAALRDCLQPGKDVIFGDDYKPSMGSHTLGELIKTIEDKRGPKDLNLYEEAIAHTAMVLQKYDSSNDLLWISFALDNHSRGSEDASHMATEEEAAQDFGIRKPVFAYAAEPKAAPSPFSIAKKFVTYYLDRETVDDHLNLGIAVHWSKPDYLEHCKDDQWFHPIYANSRLRFTHAQKRKLQKKSVGDCELANAYTDWTNRLEKKSTQRGISPRNCYFGAYEQIGGKDARLLVSATVLFKSLQETNRKSAAQLVVALSKDKRAYEIYQILQLILGSLPIAWSGVTELHSISLSMRRYQDMYFTLQEPLRRIARSIDAVQQDTQVISAVLNDPAEGLFAVRPKLAFFFEDGHTIQVNTHLTVEAAHSLRFSDKKKDEGKLLLLFVIAQVFGLQIDIPNHIVEIKDATYAALAQISNLLAGRTGRGGLFEQYLNALYFLLTGEALARNPEFKTPGLVFKSLLERDPGATLSRVKEALFTPFKQHDTNWPSAPLYLIHYSITNQTGLERDNSAAIRENWPTWTLEYSWSPLPYSAYLQFIHSWYSFAQRKDPQESKNIKCKVTHKDGSGGYLLIRLVPNYSHLKTRGGFDFLRTKMHEIATAGTYTPRQIEGNFRRPFFDLAARLAPIVDRNPTKNQRSGPYWYIEMLDKLSKNELLKVIYKEPSASSGKQRYFSISLGGTNEVTLEWNCIEGAIETPKDKTKSTIPLERNIPVVLCDHTLSQEKETAWQTVLDGMLAGSVMSDRIPAGADLERIASENAVVFLHAYSNNHEEWAAAMEAGTIRCPVVMVTAEGNRFIADEWGPHLISCYWRPGDEQDEPRFVQFLTKLRAGIFDKSLLQPVPQGRRSSLIEKGVDEFFAQLRNTPAKAVRRKTSVRRKAPTNNRQPATKKQ